MTYVQYINCSKWKKVIGITLWSFATFGIIIGEYNMIQWSLQDKYSLCLGQLQNDVTMETLEGVTVPVVTGMSCHDWQIWSPLDIIGMIIGTGATLVNTLAIWHTINRHYKILEIRCGVKPNPNEVKHE